MQFWAIVVIVKVARSLVKIHICVNYAAGWNAHAGTADLRPWAVVVNTPSTRAQGHLYVWLGLCLYADCNRSR